MGVVMVAVACLAIYIGGWVFRFLVLAGAAVMLLEWTDMHRVPRIWGYVGGLFLALSLLVVSEMLFPADMMDAAIGAASFVPAWTGFGVVLGLARSEEHKSELQSLMHISYAVFCVEKQK